MRHTLPTRPRRGFTLVELLVASALTMLIMTILASSFQTAMDSLSQLRAAGEMQDRLRSGGDRIKQDLQAPHFEDEAVANGQLGNVRFDRNALATPAAGFFRIDQTQPATEEHVGITASAREYSTTATTHRLMFTMKLPGKSRQTLFTAPREPIPASPAGLQGLDATFDNMVQSSVTTYGSRWGVVSWFLMDSGEKTTATRQPMYTLHRRVRLLAEVPNGYITPNVLSNFAHDNVTGRVFTARDVNSGYRPFNLNVINGPVDMYEPLGDGSDIVLSNVLSFEVKAEYSTVFASVSNVTVNATGITMFPRPAGPAASLPVTPYAVLQDARNANNHDFPYDNLPVNPTPAVNNLPVLGREVRAFDTGLPGGTGIGQSYRIKALQIKLRIYDPKTSSTRQMTLVQEM